MSKCILFNNKKRCLPGAYSVIGKREYSPEISGGNTVRKPIWWNGSSWVDASGATV